MAVKSFIVQAPEVKAINFFSIVHGAQNLTGDNLIVVWAEFQL